MAGEQARSTEIGQVLRAGSAWEPLFSRIRMNYRGRLHSQGCYGALSLLGRICERVTPLATEGVSAELSPKVIRRLRLSLAQPGMVGYTTMNLRSSRNLM